VELLPHNGVNTVFNINSFLWIVGRLQRNGDVQNQWTVRQFLLLDLQRACKCDMALAVKIRLLSMILATLCFVNRDYSLEWVVLH
jgi:hypothetical protein